MTTPATQLLVLLNQVLDFGPVSPAPAALGGVLAELPHEVMEPLFRFFEAHLDPSGYARQNHPPESVGGAPRLEWPQRGTYCVQIGGRERFLHPGVGELLRRELDAFLGEFCLPEPTAIQSAAGLENRLARVQTLRSTGQRVIDLIARMTDERLRLWLAPRAELVLHYCITLDRVPASFYAEIAANAAQRVEWVRLYAIDRIERSLLLPGYSEPLSPEFLRHHPFMMLDTRFFARDFVDRLLGSLGNLDEQLDGLLIHGDNFAAMKLLERQLAGRIDCIYTDPPYNTGGADLPYHDRYARPSWLTLMENRFRLAHGLLKPGGACFVSIDEHEQAALELLLSEIFGPEDFVASLVWEAGRKNDSKRVSVSHEYMLCYVKGLADPAIRKLSWRVRKEGIDEIHAKARALAKKYAGDYRRASAHLRRWLAGLPDNHPAKRHRHYCHVDERGVYHAGNISWPGGGGPRYEVLHPVTRRPCRCPSRGWMYPTPQRMQEAVAQGLVHFGEDETRVPCAKVYLHTNEQQAPASVFYRDGRAAMKRLRHILGTEQFANPKDELVIAERLGPALPKDGTVLDFFAGSGTTAHAVIHLNRADGGRRRYVLIERGDSFDAVLRTRIQRVVYSRRWKHGHPVDREGISHAFKYIRLESYEQALRNEAGISPPHPPAKP